MDRFEGNKTARDNATFTKASDIGIIEEGRLFPNTDPKEKVEDCSYNGSCVDGATKFEFIKERKSECAGMGPPLEVKVESSFPNHGGVDRKEDLKSKASNHTQRTYRLENGDEDDMDDDGDVMDFVDLIEKSRSSKEMKTLLLRILEANKTEELKLFLTESASSVLPSHMPKPEKGSLDSSSRHRRQSVRTSSRAGRSDLLGSGSMSSRDLFNSSNHSKSSRRRSVRAPNSDRSNLLAALYDESPPSPASGLMRSRQSDSSLRRLNRLPEPSRLSMSTSMHQIRTSRRGEPRSRQMSILESGGGSSGSKNATWDSVPSGGGNGRRRMSSSLNLLNQDLRPTGIQHSNLDSSETFERLRSKSLRKMNLVVEKDDNGTVDTDKDDKDDGYVVDKATRAKNRQGFAQFESTGKVGFRQQTEGLHDLLDDLRLMKDSDSPNEDTESLTSKEEKKGIRSFLSLTKQKLIHNSQKDLNDSLSSFQSMAY